MEKQLKIQDRMFMFCLGAAAIYAAFAMWTLIGTYQVMQ